MAQLSGVDMGRTSVTVLLSALRPSGASVVIENRPGTYATTVEKSIGPHIARLRTYCHHDELKGWQPTLAGRRARVGKFGSAGVHGLPLRKPCCERDGRFVGTSRDTHQHEYSQRRTGGGDNDDCQLSYHHHWGIIGHLS